MIYTCRVALDIVEGTVMVTIEWFLFQTCYGMKKTKICTVKVHSDEAEVLRERNYVPL